MFTTAGMARFAASLNEEIFFASPSGEASRMVTTLPRGLHDRRSGRRVVITNRPATQTVAVWQNTSHSLRIIGADEGTGRLECFFRLDRSACSAQSWTPIS